MGDKMSFFDNTERIVIDGKDVYRIYDEVNDMLIYSPQMEIDINLNSTSFTLPNMEFEDSLIIDWGDGSIEEVTTTTRGVTHNFNMSKSTGKIKIIGIITKLTPGFGYSWTGVQRLHLPNGLIEIGEYTFRYSPIPTLVLPPSLKTLAGKAFRECTALTTIKLNEGLETLSAEAFCGCKNLKQISIPNSVSFLGSFCFDEAGVIDYQLYWETPPFRLTVTNLPNWEDTYYTIPNGCTENYVSKNFPREKLIERSD